MFRVSRTLAWAHWYAGTKWRHRANRELRFHPNNCLRAAAKNRFSQRVHYKTNRWNYRAAYKDMP
jgi:hypothetical protein